MSELREKLIEIIKDAQHGCSFCAPYCIDNCITCRYKHDECARISDNILAHLDEILAESEWTKSPCTIGDTQDLKNNFIKKG